MRRALIWLSVWAVTAIAAVLMLAWELDRTRRGASAAREEMTKIGRQLHELRQLAEGNLDREDKLRAIRRLPGVDRDREPCVYEVGSLILQLAEGDDLILSKADRRKIVKAIEKCEKESER